MSSRWELPVPDENVDGAADVLFPWSPAQTALNKLDELLDRIATYRNEDRPALVGSVEDWEGPYRNEFDEVEGIYLTDLRDLVTALENMGDDIVHHADQANLEQEDRNDEALDEQDDDENGGDD